MADAFDHTVLIIDDEEQIAKSIGRLLRSIGVNHVYLASGEGGLKRLKSDPKPFSLILSDQRMPGMKGSEFLEQAKELSPDTIRFLITGYSDMAAVRDAVNKGSIHRYIAKPWDNNEFLEAIKDGLKQYELITENQRLFKLAKERNKKLYDLNITLKESAEEQRRRIIRLDKEIGELNEILTERPVNRDFIGEIRQILEEKNRINPENLNSLYAALISELYKQFRFLAAKNGFEMPTNLPWR